MSDHLHDMPAEWASQLVMHPIHRDAYPTLVQLIADLRQCQGYPDYREFQQLLLARILDVQTHWLACRRIAKRLRNGKTVPVDAPELRSGNDVTDPESWKLEAETCERVDRQFRSIGDALAWRVFNYDRRVIMSLSRNEQPGPMAGKVGLRAEQDFAAEYAGDDDKFVLLHDLTSCLRIGDATLFVGAGNEYEAYLHEIKSNPNKRNTAQRRRKRLAEEAVRDGGPLPGDPTARLVHTDIPYKTHLDMLRDAFALAQRRGVQGMKVPGGRALVAADIQRGYTLWSEQEFLNRTDTTNRQALKRAGIANVGNQVTYVSDDLVARSPTMPPWAIFPLSPLMCANLIVDAAVYITTISSESLINALSSAGIRAEWALPDRPKRIEAGRVVLNAHRGGRTVQMRQSELQRLLFELVDLTTWIAGIDRLLGRSDIPGHPWPHYTDEWRVWA